MLLIAMGFYISRFTINTSSNAYNLKDKLYSPIQLISQIKGFLNINYFLSLSLAITIFSFAGIPPLIGFFAKQMVLSAALDSGYIFLAIIAILTSVIGAVYYLNIIKQMFFDKSEYNYTSYIESDITVNMTNYRNSSVNDKNSAIIKKLANINEINKEELQFIDKKQNLVIIKKLTKDNGINNVIVENLGIKEEEIKLSDYLTITISILTLIIILFFLTPKEWLSMTNMLSLIIFNT